MKLNKGFLVKEMMGEYMLVPTGDNVGAFDGTVVLNGISAFILKQLESGEKTNGELVDAVLEEYEADRQTVERDVDALLVKLRDYGVVSLY